MSIQQLRKVESVIYAGSRLFIVINSLWDHACDNILQLVIRLVKMCHSTV